MALKKKVRIKKKVKIFILNCILTIILAFSIINIFSWGKDNRVNNKVKKDIIEDVKIEEKQDEEEP